MMTFLTEFKKSVIIIMYIVVLSYMNSFIVINKFCISTIFSESALFSNKISHHFVRYKNKTRPL